MVSCETKSWPGGKLGQEWASLKVKREQSAPSMSTGTNVPGKSAPHLASSLALLPMGMLWEEPNDLWSLFLSNLE